MTSPTGTKAGSAEPWMGPGPRGVHVCTGGHSQPGPGPGSEVSFHRVCGSWRTPRKGAPRFLGAVSSAARSRVCLLTGGGAALLWGSGDVAFPPRATASSDSKHTQHASAKRQGVRPV